MDFIYPRVPFFAQAYPEWASPNGLRFIDYIRDTIDETRLVIFLVSPGFLESKFCLAESGAAWVKSVDQIILLTPSLRPKDETPESAKLTTSSAPLSGEAQQLLSA